MKDNIMFRYLLNYVGKYQVECHKTLDTNSIPSRDGEIDPTFDDLYIPCAVGEIRGCYTPHLLMWFSGETPRASRIGKVKSTAAKFEKAGIPHELDLYDGEGCITFREEDLDKAAKILRPKKSKSRVSPYGGIIEKPKKKRKSKKEKK